jgi:hypothetical protein
MSQTTITFKVSRKSLMNKNKGELADMVLDLMDREFAAHNEVVDKNSVLEIIGNVAELWTGKTDGMVQDAFYEIAKQARARFAQVQP